MSFNVGNRQVFGLRGNGNALFYDPSSIATEFRVSSVVLKGDSASFSTLSVDGRGSFGGIVSAQNFVTLSDISAKRDISEYIGNDRMIIVLELPFSDADLTNLSACSITDPTDFSDPTAPVIFVPTTDSRENYFIKQYLYNETLTKSVKYFDLAKFDIVNKKVTYDGCPL
jgi:hypothetical protein